MDVKKLLHMTTGTSANSYAKSSYIQKQALSLTKLIKEEAIREYYIKERPKTLCIADLGCGSAENNTLGVVSRLIAAVEGARKQLGDEPPEYLVSLSDLPANDFNTLFTSLGSFEDTIQREIIGDNDGDRKEEEFGRHHCFVNAVPGSFYGRLFPSNSLHFVHSSYSLMWLSQVPKGIEENKGNIYIARTSPPSVQRAFLEQFEQDFSTFLRCRSKEVVPGGRMVLTMLGRKTIEPYSKESSYMYDLLATVLNDMVFEGLIEEDKLNTFNFPQYNPSTIEVEIVVKKEGSFTLEQVHVSQIKWKPEDNNSSEDFGYPERFFHEHDYSYNFTRCIRSVSEPLLVSHFGEGIIDQVFHRYRELAHISMTNENNSFVSVTVTMTRKL